MLGQTPIRRLGIAGRRRHFEHWIGFPLDITIPDRFGKPFEPKEWFLVPLFVINEAVDRIRDGSITGYVYDPKAAKLVKAPAKKG